MKTQLAVAVIGLLSLASLGLAPRPPEPGEHVVDTNKLLEETQLDLPGKDSVGFVWWLPSEFWRASMAEEGDVPKETAELLVARLARYTVLIVVDGEMNDASEITFVSEPDLRKSLKLVDPRGETHLPLKDSEVDAETKELLHTMKPMFTDAAGKMGDNLQIFFFEGKSKDGKTLIDPMTEGLVQVKVGERNVRFRLPLGSLLPEKTCPTCNESLSGAWKFCPWDGAALKAAAQAK